MRMLSGWLQWCESWLVGQSLMVQIICVIAVLLPVVYIISRMLCGVTDIIFSGNDTPESIMHRDNTVEN